MIITPQSLQALQVGFSNAYQTGLARPETHYQQVATVIPGTGKSTTYGWLGGFPVFREWVGERQFKDMQTHAYTVVNKKFESSVSVPRDDIEDDEVGVYAPMFEEMGQAAAEHPDRMVFGLLQQGFDELCYDGQSFFDTDHPVYENTDGTGEVTAVSNMQAGSGKAWYLLDTTRSLKPLIYQLRRKIDFKTMTKPEDSQGVWLRDEYEYGADGRMNAGFGFWQMAFGSKAELTIENLRKAQAAMEGFRGDGNKVLNVQPKLLVVPTALRQQAEDILDKQLLAGGESNPMYKKFDLLVTGYL